MTRTEPKSLNLMAVMLCMGMPFVTFLRHGTQERPQMDYHRDCGNDTIRNTSKFNSTNKANKMIGYVTLGTNDLERATKFYDELLAEIGAKRFMEDERFIAWSVSPDKPALFIMKPFNGEIATVGNGVMVALAVETPKQVDALYAKAIALGATDEGASGPRQMGFYAGFFRDLDGNKLNCFCMQ